MPDLELYSVKDGCVPTKSGLNWGFSNGHVSTEDAYIALTVNFFRHNQGFFPSQGNTITTKWDDGQIIECLLEGTQEINGVIFPKQISSFNDKSILGSYLRRRLNVSSMHIITMDDLDSYGRNYISVSNLGNNRYYFDFSAI